MKIEKVNKGTELEGKLNAFVERHAIVFNSPAWLSCFPEAQVSRCAICNKNGEVIGCFVYYTFTKAIFKFVINLPCTPDIDLFYLNPSNSVVGRNTFNKDIVSLVADYFNHIKADLRSINLPAFVTDTQPFIWKKYRATSRFTYVLDLSKNEKELYDNLASEKRQSLNKAQKEQLEIMPSSDYAAVHELAVKSLKRNRQYKNPDIIKNILLRYADANNSFAFVARKNGKIIASTFCLIYRNRAIYLFGGFDDAQKSKGAGVSCMWQSILKAKALGLSEFDFEGSMNESIERYFREFGGQLVPYSNVEKVGTALELVMKGKKR